MAECTRQHRSLDASRRSAGDDVDNDAQFHIAADGAKQIEINLLGIEFRIVAVALIEEGGMRAFRAVGYAVQHTRGAHELEHLLADAMHVDGERNAPEAHERYSKFLFA